MVLLLIAALGLGLMQWHQWQQQQQLQQSQSQWQERLAGLEGGNKELRDDLRAERDSREQRLNRLASRIEGTRDQQSEMRRQIEHNAQALLGLGQRTRTDWLLAEAEYLMRLANQRLFFEGDFSGALAMLKSADQVLAETDDVGAYPVRQALAREVLALRAIDPVDQAGLYLRLDAAIDQLEQLTDQTLTGYRGITDPAAQEDQENADNPWARIVDTLREIVVIRRMDQPVTALPSPQQSTQARLHLRLMLEEAGIAVLRRNQTVYERSLARAEQWLQQWYEADSPQVRALQNTLDELAQKQIDPPLPDISQSLELLKSRIAGRLERTEETRDELEETLEDTVDDSGDAQESDS
ncbi:MAG: hypothetical protein EA349_13395 [Halomonadaceae bacterium]|nr:MAG: hypothetical protein EA349_13395 [Halomonadaceae bacterium]